MRKRITDDTYNKVVNMAHRKEHLEIDCIEEMLADSYFIKAQKEIDIGDEDPKEFIILLVTPKTTWTYAYTLITTDSEKTFNNIFNERKNSIMAI